MGKPICAPQPPACHYPKHKTKTRTCKTKTKTKTRTCKR